MFDVGIKVVCVDDRFDKDALMFTSFFPKKDEVYTVRDVIPAFDWDMKETCAILLEEINNPPNDFNIENGFAAHRFRELDETNEQEEAEEKEQAQL